MTAEPRKIKTSDRLIRAAEAELIATHGHLEMQAVAKRAKLSVGLAYHHFGSKAGLIAAVVANFFAPEQAATEAAAQGDNIPWAARERRRIRAMVDYYFDHPLAPLIVGPLSRAPEVLEIEQAHMQRQLEEGARNLRYAQRKQVISPQVQPELAIAMVLGGVYQVIRRALESNPRPDRTALSEQIWDFVAGALDARQNS